MSATPKDLPSVTERARTVIEEICRSAGEPDEVRLSVILSGPRPSVLIGPSALASQGLPLLQKWNPQLPRHSYLPALEVANRLADSGGEIYLVTDHPEEARTEVGDGIRIRGVGIPSPNVGITLADRALNAGGPGTTVNLRLFNSSDEPATRSLMLEDEKAASLTLAPREERTLALAVGPEHGVVRVRLLEPDTLASDNQVLLVEPQPRNIRIRCTLPEKSRTSRKFEKVCKAVPHTVWMSASDPDGPHLIISTPETSARTDDVWVLSAGTLPPEQRQGEELSPLIGPYIPDASHPLMSGLDWRGVIWSGAYAVQPGAFLLPLMTAGEVPLILESRTQGTPAFTLNIDLTRSNVHKSPAWVLFFHNLISLRRDAIPGLRRWNYRPGETVAYRLQEHEKLRLSARGPDAAPLAGMTHRSRFEIHETWTSGLYEIRDDRTGDPIDRFAVNLQDPAESDLTTASSLSFLPRSTAAQTALQETLRWPWLDPLLVMLILLLIVADLILVRGHA